MARARDFLHCSAAGASLVLLCLATQACVVSIPDLADSTSTSDGGVDARQEGAVDAGPEVGETGPDVSQDASVDTLGDGRDDGEADSGSDAAGDTVIVCEGGTEDCDGDPANGCEDLSSDPKHCGSCGHDCLGGACEQGACQPVLLASGLLRPFGLAKDDDFVYGTGDSSNTIENAQVWKVPVVGCANPANCASIMTASGSQYQDIAIDDEAVYVTDQQAGRVARLTKNGLQQCDIAVGQAKPQGVALRDGYVYWTDMGRDMILRAPAQCQTPLADEEVVIADTPSPSILRGDDSGVYWTSDDGGLVSWSTWEGDQEASVWTGDAEAGSFIFGPALDDAWVYFREGSQGGDGRLIRAAKDRSGDYDVVAENQPIPRYVVVDETHAYFGAKDALVRVEKDGAGSVETLVSGDEYKAVHGVVLDEVSVFFCNWATEGKLYRLAK